MNYSLFGLLKPSIFRFITVSKSLVFAATSLIANKQDLDGNRIFDFYLKNMSDAPMDVLIIPGSCYEGQPRKKMKIKINPQLEYKMIIAWIQGNGCDGRP